jgi:hypothetical protein
MVLFAVQRAAPNKEKSWNAKRWVDLSAAVSKVDAAWKDSRRYAQRTAVVVVRVHLWGATPGAHQYACANKTSVSVSCPV